MRIASTRPAVHQTIAMLRPAELPPTIKTIMVIFKLRKHRYERMMPSRMLYPTSRTSVTVPSSSMATLSTGGPPIRSGIVPGAMMELLRLNGGGAIDGALGGVMPEASARTNSRPRGWPKQPRPNAKGRLSFAKSVRVTITQVSRGGGSTPAAS